MDKWGIGALAASLLAMGVGCSSSSSNAKGGADASTDGGVSGEAGGDASEAGSADVCGAFFDAFVACGGAPNRGPFVPADTTLSPLLPASEIARVRGRYETVCAAEMALPGTGFTASAVAACTAAIKSKGCSSGESDPACSFFGTRAPGASCVDSEQCGYGCDTFTQTDAGTFVQQTCGTCGAAAAVGQPCALTPFNTNPCGAGATCDFGAPSIDGGTGPASSTCVANTIVGAGQSCGAGGQECTPGTYCYSPAQGTPPTCMTAGKVGDPCPGGSSTGGPPQFTVPGSCTAPLICTGGDAGGATCQPPGGSGASCQQDSDCASGLGCVIATGGQPPGTCGTVTFVAAGQTCGGSVRCLQGYCGAGGPGGPTCPAVTADGQACPMNTMGGPPIPSAACDAYSTCVNGNCTLGYATCP